MPSKITSEQLEDLVGWGTVDGFRRVSDEQIDSGRWLSYHTIVWLEGNKFYAYDYEQGLTEMQEADNDWNVDDIYEVQPVEVTTVRYEKV